MAIYSGISRALNKRDVDGFPVRPVQVQWAQVRVAAAVRAPITVQPAEEQKEEGDQTVSQRGLADQVRAYC